MPPQQPNPFAQPVTSRLTGQLLADLAPGGQTPGTFGSIDSLTKPPAAASQQRPVDLDKWLRWIKRGHDGELAMASLEFAAAKPLAAVPELLKLAGDRWLESKRRYVALRALADIGDPACVPELIQMSGRFLNDLQPMVCLIAANAARPDSLSYLEKQAKDGPFASRILGLVGVARIDRARATPLLALGAHEEAVKLDYHEDSDNALTRSSSFGLFLVGMAVGMWAANKWATLSASYMVIPSISLDDVQKAPGPVRRAWNMHKRQQLLVAIALADGVGGIMACRRSARTSLQHLMIAHPLLYLGERSPELLQALHTSARAPGAIERLLAYEEYLILGEVDNDNTYIQAAAQGLEDRDKQTRIAMGAAVLLRRIPVLTSNALALALDRSADVRIALMAPTMAAAVVNMPGAEAAVQALLNDSDRGVREAAQEMWAKAQALIKVLAAAEAAVSTGQAAPAPATPSPAPPPAASAAAFCRHCGHVARPGANFCSRCGERLA